MSTHFYKKSAGLFIISAILIIHFGNIHANDLVDSVLNRQTQKASLSLTLKEQEWLASHKQIKVAVKSGWMPIEFRLAKELHRGIAVDYLAQIKKLTSIHIETVEYTEDIDTSQADVISSVNGNSLKTSQFKLLKQPYMVIPNAIYINKIKSNQFTNKSLEDFKYAKIAVYRNSTVAKNIRENFPNLKLVYVDIIDEALNYVKSGTVDAYVGNELVVDYHIAFYRLKFVEKSGLTPFTSNISMAVRADEPLLASILEKTLLVIGQNNAELTDTWTYKTNVQERLLKGVLAAIVIILFIVSFRFYLSKKKASLQLAENQQKIWHQANFDYLTNLPNRYLLQNRLANALLRADRLKSKVGLLYIDLDHFKHVNDFSGHAVGDKLLQQAAKRISNCIREEDTTARLGGDEFMVVISDFNSTLALENICQKILNSLQLPFEIDKDIFYITASIGVTVYPDDSLNSEELIKHADQAMYAGKKLGRNLYQFFTQSMQTSASNRVSILNDLRTALANNQFELYYQPILSTANSKIVKAEALIRWNHPINGVIGPDDFIYLAEESGLILELGHWVFNQAIHDLIVINKKLKLNFQLNINVSPRQFSQPQHLIDLVELLKQNNISGENICLEITEGLLLEAQDIVINTINTLKEAGMQFAIDDFGTGYSALYYLKKFNISYVKIDKSFIQNLQPDNYDAILCGSIIQMAHKLDIKLVAEGVENHKQEKILKEFNCDYVQGYLYGKAQPLNELLALIECQSEH